MDFTKCPYNPSHQFQPEKYQWHILRCKEGKRIKHNFAKCKFNNLHIFPKQDIICHEVICPDRAKGSKMFKNLEQLSEKAIKKKEQKSFVKVPTKKENSFKEEVNLQNKQKHEYSEYKTLEECEECQQLLNLFWDDLSSRNVKILRKLVKKYHEQ